MSDLRTMLEACRETPRVQEVFGLVFLAVLRKEQFKLKGYKHLAQTIYDQYTTHQNIGRIVIKAYLDQKVPKAINQEFLKVLNLFARKLDGILDGNADLKNKILQGLKRFQPSRVSLRGP